MKTLLRSVLLLATCSLSLLALTGCVGSAVTAAQAEGKLPAADIEEASVEISTIYGSSYQLEVKNVVTRADGSKRYGEYQSRATSPLGSATVKAKGVKVKAPKAKGDAK